MKSTALIPTETFFIVRIETKGEMHSEPSLDELCSSREDAQAAADRMNEAGA